jgi:membrane protein YqaA with SNARE-associated domain
MARSAQEREESLRETQAGPVYDRLGPKVWTLGGVMVLIGLVTTYLILQDFRSESYIYLAFYSIPANAAISFFPHEPVLIYFGKFANLWLAAAAATVGTVVAGVMDHTVFVPLLNHRTVIAYKDKKFYKRTIDYFLKYPFATLAVAGFTPIPFFPFKFLSFSIHYPLKKYLAALVVARYPRYFLLAWLGAVTDIPNWLLFAAFLVIINLYMIKALPALARKLREAARRRGNRAAVGGRPEQSRVEPAEAGP